MGTVEAEVDVADEPPKVERRPNRTFHQRSLRLFDNNRSGSWEYVCNRYADAIQRVYRIKSDSYARLNTCCDYMEKFFFECVSHHCRNASLLFMVKTYDNLKRIIGDEVEHDAIEMAQRICIRYAVVLKARIDADCSTTLGTESVPNHLWNEAMKIAVNFKVPKAAPGIDKLLFITDAESRQRRNMIHQEVLEMIRSKEKFYFGVAWIRSFSLDNIKQSEFQNICFRAHIYQNQNALEFILITPEDQLSYLKTLDNILERRQYRRLSELTPIEKEFISAVTLAKLPSLISKQARRFDIDIEAREFAAHRYRVTAELRHMLDNGDANFDDFVLQSVSKRSIEYQIDFVKILCQKRRHREAYAWAMYFNLPVYRLPYSIREYNITFETQGQEWMAKLRQRQLDAPVATDSIEHCEIFGKQYKLIMVSTADGLKEFTQLYIIEKKPEVIGIDCEAGSLATGTGNKVTVLQLATSEWLCLIDVYLLLSSVSKEEWTSFFELVFDPTIVRCGFAFASDYAYLVGGFPYLTSFFQETERKVLCISKLVQTIIVDDDANKAVFPVTQPANVSLAGVCENLLQIKLNKDMQNSNWVQRPLSYDQKVYAVTDALVVTLLKEKIENDLKAGLGEDDANSLLSSAFITYGVKGKSKKKDENVANK